MGDKLLILLLVEYVVIALVYLCQKDFIKGLYFIGAIVINLAVLLMK